MEEQAICHPSMLMGIIVHYTWITIRKRLFENPEERNDNRDKDY